jgi:hypothetical protein
VGGRSEKGGARREKREESRAKGEARKRSEK